MKPSRKGASPLALITDSLPVRGRIGVVLMMADLAVERLEGSPDFPAARAAFDLDRRWYDGERFDPDRFEEAHWDEEGRGVSPAAMDARSQSELAAWSVLGSANLYIAFQAYREIGSLPSPVVSEVEEDELDEIYRHMRTISPNFIDTAKRAAEIFIHGQQPSFAELKASLSSPRR
jgi:Immunity protein Imm6